jgi:predicted permease
METLRVLWAKLRGQAAQKQEDELFDEEIHNHIALLEERYTAQGLSAREAARAARLQFGSATALKERQRVQRGILLLEEWWRDVRFALRMLRNSPGFASIAIGSLALGIGANTVIFTVAQHMLLDRLSVSHPEQLRMLEWTQPSNNGVIQNMWGWFAGSDNSELSTSFSYQVYEQMRRQNRSMEALLAFKPLGEQTVNVNGHAESDDVQLVSGNYFSALGVQPQLGRAIEEADDGTVGSGPVVVISDLFWTNHFGRSAAVIGKTIMVNTTPLTVVGVAPRGFTGAYSAQDTPDVFLPLSMQPIVSPPDWSDAGSPNLLTDPKLWWVLVMGRVKAGVPDAKAAAELNVTMDAAVRVTMPVKDKAMPRLLVIDGSRGQNPDGESLSRPIYVLMGLAGFVLLLACANLANLLLARGSARQREMSVRVALGAARWRILRQVLTENLMLSIAGGATGLALAYAVRNAIPRLLAESWEPPAFAARFDWRIFGFALLVGVATGLVFGLGPALAATRVEVSTALKDAAQTATRRRGLAARSIVVVQVAISMVLVVGAGLFVQTLAGLAHTRLGFNPDRITLFGIAPPQAKYPHAASTRLYREIEQKLASIPGVERAALTRIPLISGNVSMHTFVPEGTTRKKDGSNPNVLMDDVGRDFFATFEIPIVAGRGFDSTDTETSRKVAVVNEALAKKYFPNVTPIGRTFEDGFHTPTQIEIVGVCADAKYDRVRKDPEPTFYMPYWEEKDGVGWTTFAVKTHMDGAELAPLLRKTVASIDGSLPLESIHTQREQIDATMRDERIFADLAGGFGVLALVLAAVGIYGILAYSVSRRTSEIGIRMALGARPGIVLRMVLREAAWMAGLGILVGLCAALGIGRLIADLLYGLKAWDPTTLVGAAGLLAVTALAASWMPARRAAGVDPMRALRHE